MSAFADLPAVNDGLDSLADIPLPRTLVVAEVRRSLDQARMQIRQSGEVPGALPNVAAIARARLDALQQPSLRRVINATGVVLHTNLGRAPLPALPALEGYSNLEYDLAAGRRGKRDAHCSPLLEQLLGAPALVVNNNAAAVYLALHELAAGGEVIVSRGELIEIGDGFRIPDIMAHSGAALHEAGTTNRTRIEDYSEAITERTRLLLIVHPSNFHISGFTSKPSRAAIAALGRERGLPVYEDLGSGCLADLRPFGVDEPRPQDSLADGVSLVSFSGDKLLGGPQAGILAGDPLLVARLRRNPMFRALRVDKLITTALETTLRHTLLEQWDRIPALRMIAIPAERIKLRAGALCAALPGAELIPGESLIGGGSTPDQSLPTWLIAIRCDAVKVERRLREHSPPVIARIEDERIIIDLRTVLEEEEGELRNALSGALA